MKYFLSIFMTTACFPAFAAPSLLIARMLASDTVAKVEQRMSFPSLIQVEQIAEYRCRSCYDFRLSYRVTTENSTREQLVYIHTFQNDRNELSVESLPL